jgi:phosphoglycerol transferase MdoB-like AlkP superfamily enzyme
MEAPTTSVAELKLRSRATSSLICLIGLGIILATLLVDRLTGAANPHFGAKQLIGCFVGVGILALGILLSPSFTSPTNAAIRWGSALYLATSSLIVSQVWPADAATWILLGYIAAACILLPLHFGALTIVGIAVLHVLLTWISKIKTDLTGLPLTVLDIKIALANPAGLWDALSLPHWTRYLAITIIVIALLCWLIAGLNAVGRLVLRHRRSGLGPDAAARFAVVGILGFLIFSHLKTVNADAARDKSTWHPERVARLADRMGVLPFLAYSYLLEAKSTGDIYRTDDSASPPSVEEVRASVLQYLDFPTAANPGSQVLPNVMVVLAESTFDPGEAFRLRGTWDDELFRTNERTAANGLLRVNTEGGGTWITEFETIVGLDSRLFGYSGMYTHASLSPFVGRSFATYMREHGYRTWAFFPHGGDFYNARNAYENYGFQNILDSADLGHGNWIETDREVAASVQAALGPAPDSPFFGYVLLIENHSPHECDATDASSFLVHFTDTNEFTPNCALNDYLRRLGATTAAVQSLTAYLADIEVRTGRTFVLLVFGDHQPYSFTSTGGTQYDYSALRKPLDTYMTFFHIMSTSPAKKLRCCSVAPPATMLPTLLSGFVAEAPDDVYLGVNLWLHARCGSDPVRRDFGSSMSSLEMRTLDERTKGCEAAYKRALSWYRTSGVIRLGGEPTR